MKPNPIVSSEQPDADDPGQLARVLVGGLEEDPQQVEDQEHDHQVGAPVMDAPDQPAELTSLVMYRTLS